MSRSNLIIFNKPFGVLSQFSGVDANLSDYISCPGFYPAGRLDKDSEGLLLLTNDGHLQARISQPNQKMAKTYWVQIEGLVGHDSLASLRKGITLKDGHTRPARARLIEEPIQNRSPDIRRRQAIPTSWIELTITEGKNRQVRRMTAAVGHPTLRLYRAKIGPWSVNDLKVGEYQCLSVRLPQKKRPEKRK